MARIARRKLAQYIVHKLENGTSAQEALRELAAHLIESRRTREYELIVRDIEDQLAERGIVIADVVSAHPLSDALRQEVIRTIGGNVTLRESVDETLLGGIRIDLPGKRYDGTIRWKLNALKAKQL